MKIPDGQEDAPRLKPVVPIRLADRNHAYYPSRRCTILKKRWLDDELQARAVRSKWESSENVTHTLEAPPSKVAVTVIPAPEGQASDA